MALNDELRQIADAAIRFAEPGEDILGIVPAEPGEGVRAYLCAFGGVDDGSTSWLVLDAGGVPVDDRAAVREIASIAAMCELAEEVAAGGDLDELRSQLVALRITENPPGVEDAEAAVSALQTTIGAPPRLATPAHLDEVGVATLRLEQALGEGPGSPFAEAMKHGLGAIEALVADIESNYKRELD